jgi:Domain of unknown function (DUF4249)
MHKLLKYIILILIFTSCDKYLEIDVPSKPSEVVINSINSADSLFQFHITKSVEIGNNFSGFYIENAVINIYENEILKESIIHFQKGLYKSTIKPIINNSYKIEVIPQDFEIAIANIQIPQPPQIISSSFEKTFINYDYVDIKLKIDDPANEENFYMINVKTFEEFEGLILPYTAGVFSYFESFDPNLDLWINHNGIQALISDKIFDGNEYEFSILIAKGNFLHNRRIYGKGMANVYINSISKDYFLYAKSYKDQLDAKNNPMAEPVKVHTNIENGLGIFTIYSTAKDSIVVEW